MSVLVTGATGYIALHVIQTLLKENYKVIGTVRSQAKAEKLIKQFNNPALSFEIVPEIAELGAFDHVLQKRADEIKYVIHMASPVTFETTEFEKDILIPAINGAKNILEAIKKYAPKTVKQVVLTSSIVAAMDISNPGPINEESWNPITWEEALTGPMAAYSASKKFAEQAAWKFLEDNKNEVSFKLNTVNPTFVFGPQAFDEDSKGKLNFSADFLKQMLDADPDSKYENTEFGSFIDVRDVARAHVLSIQKEELAGKRLLLCEQSFSQQQIVNILHKHFPKLSAELPSASSEPFTITTNTNNQKTRGLLGFTFRDLDTTTFEAAYQILKAEGRI